MNISGASQATWIETEYLSSKGNRQTLKSVEDASEKAAAIKFLSQLECRVCFDVYEKPLSTRCCEMILCASCYFALPDPKKCPNHRKEFTGSIQDDLQCTGRLINNQIESFAGLFKNVPSTGTSNDKYKSRVQNDAIQRINSSPSQSTVRTSQHVGQNEMLGNTRGYGNVYSGASSEFGNIISSFGNRAINSQASDSYSVNYASGTGRNFRSGGNIHIGVGDSITVNGRQVQGTNLVIRNGEILSGQNVSITTPPWVSAPVRKHDFRADNVHFIGIHTGRGDILIEGQNARNQHQVSVISSKEPSLGNNNLYLDCCENIQLRLPESFVSRMKLHTNMGNINTQSGYRVKSGGELHTNMGNVNVKVDSLLVNANGRTNMGNRSVNIQNQHVPWGRQDLHCKSNIGNVYIYDQG